MKVGRALAEAGAVVVPGNLVVQSNVKTIQHPTGGGVSQIPVRNGMRVNAGDLLFEIDPAQYQIVVDRARAGRAEIGDDRQHPALAQFILQAI